MVTGVREVLEISMHAVKPIYPVDLYKENDAERQNIKDYYNGCHKIMNAATFHSMTRVERDNALYKI